MTIRYNQTKYLVFVDVAVYKDGKLVLEKTGEVDDASSLKNVEFYWDPAGFFKISIKTLPPTVFSWEDTALESGPANLTYIAIKSTNPSTIRQKDSFMWITDLLQECPDKNAYFSCELKMNQTGRYAYLYMRIVCECV